MPTFTRDEVLRLALLARLQLSEDEIHLFARQLGDILQFARQIDTVDTSSIATREPPDAPDALRDDEVLPPLDRDEVLARAPEGDLAAGLFKVPRVLNG